MKSTKYGQITVDAIKHMIGQSQDLFNRGVTIAEIAAWMRVSKPTAKRFVEKNHIGIDVHMKDWRKGHSVVYVYTLSAPSFSAYRRGVYYASYRMFVEVVFGREVVA